MCIRDRDSDDSKLDRLMKDHKSDYIEDSGFTYRVMGALPRDRRIAGNRRRFILLVSSSLLSVSLALVLAGPGFLPGLFAQFQFAINHPVLDLFGVSFGAIQMCIRDRGFTMYRAKSSATAVSVF